MINLPALQSLIGFEITRETQINSQIAKLKKSPPKKDAFKQRKNAIRGILMPLIIKGVTPKQLEYDFKANIGL
jgi:hypothetical protein